MKTEAEDQNQERKQENRAYRLNSYIFTVYLYPPFSCGLQYNTYGPSGLRAEALGIFLLQMVISN